MSVSGAELLRRVKNQIDEVDPAEVNELIQCHYWDCATLRRELIGYRMLTRAEGVYWRQPEAQWLAA